MTGAPAFVGRVTILLDSSAVLAIIEDQPGADRAREPFPEVALPTVNDHEVVTTLVGRGLSDAEVDGRAGQIAIAIHPDGAVQARAAGLSLGGRACLALGVPVMTAGRAWVGCDAGVAIEVIR